MIARWGRLSAAKVPWLCLIFLVPSAVWSTQLPPGAAVVEGPRTLTQARTLLKDQRYAQAETLARELLAAAEATEGAESLQAAAALDLLVESLWRGQKGKEPETRELAERAVAIKERVLGSDHLDLAASLHGAAEVLRASRQYTEAMALCERALTIREKVLGPKHVDFAQSLSRLANLLRLTGDTAKAMTLAARAVAITEEALGRDHPELTESLHYLAEVVGHTSDYPRKCTILRRVLEIEERAHGPDHLIVASRLNDLGRSLRNLGEYDEALSLFERALAIREQSLGRQHPSVASILNNIAVVLEGVGDFSRSRECYERAIRIREAVFGADDVSVAGYLGNLGTHFMRVGDYARARASLERSRAILESALGPEHPFVALSITNLSRVSLETGDYDAARSLAERAVAIKEEAWGPDHTSVAWSLVDLARSLEVTGNTAGARSLYERALAIYTTKVGPEHSYVAVILYQIGELLEDNGEFDSARPFLERSLAISEKALRPDHPDVACSLANLADLHSKMGDFARAQSLFDEALAIVEKASGAEHPDVATHLTEFARHRLRIGEPAVALESALRAQGIVREQQRLVTRSLSERHALKYAVAAASSLDLALSIAAHGRDQIPDVESEVWDALVRSRALVLDEMAARNRTVGEASDPETARLAAEFRTTRQRLANLTVRGPGPVPLEQHRRLLDEALQEKENAESAFAERSLSFRQEQARQRLGLAEVRASMPRGSGLVAFVRYGHIGLTVHPSKPDEPQRDGPASPASYFTEPVASYLAFVLGDPQSQPVLIPLGAAAEIESLALRWGQEAARGLTIAGRSTEQAEAAYRAAGEALRHKVWDPVASHLEDTTLVFVVPAGTLHLVSLAALPAGAAGYLIEGRSLIHYLSAERDLVPPSKAIPLGNGLLALGAPDFDGDPLSTASAPDSAGEQQALARQASLRPFRGSRSGCGDFRSLHFAPLAHSGQEVEEIAALWEGGARGRTHAQRLTGAEASETAFKSSAPGKRLLHLATHGFFLDGRCPSTLEGVPQATGLDEQSAAVARENPLLLVGLALAGANQRETAGPGQDDGILTAEEVASIDLSGVEWAVLSSCETGVGELKAGEGVFGLRRAFQIAGVRTLITSLWAVDDEATREWMGVLYEQRFRIGLRTAAAVRNASLQVLRRRSQSGESTHPFYWGAYVSSGDWR